MKRVLWRVAVEAPVPEVLTYEAPADSQYRRGQLVKVPLGRRVASGVLLGTTTENETQFETKLIIEHDDEYPVVPEPTLQWLEWLAQYYLYPPGLVTSLAYPPLSKKNRRAQKTKEEKVFDFRPQHELNEEQKKVVEEVSKNTTFQAHLLFGVTGSGKTEVYLKLLELCLEKGLPGLVLVPEISLTPQLFQRFKSRFGPLIATIHSQLTEREKTNQWWQMISGEKKILIGARSALFCPVPQWGLIVIDEEHEQSYKQEEKLKYHARDAAIVLAQKHNCPILLGSATPSLESWQNTKTGKFQLHCLKSRVEGRSLPEIHIIDLRQEKGTDKEDHTRPFWMSQVLREKIEETLEQKNQVALFLNRRGMAHVVICATCGHTRMCPNCDINLTLHADSHLICHYCGYHENLRQKCPECKVGELEPLGLGTERVEKDLQKLYPEKMIARADRDEIQNQEALENLIQQMESGEIDLLIGTQMIAKGLDFPRLKLVGLLLADIGFNMPDFRSTERSFQLISQMAGRSGRHIVAGEQPGQVILQTYNTEHESLAYAVKHDYEGFAQNELESRELLKYPPCGRLILFKILSPEKDLASKAAKKLAERCHRLKQNSENYREIEVLGPAPSALAKVRNQFRFQVLLKGIKPAVLSVFVRQVLGHEGWTGPRVRIITDVDPTNML